MSSCSSMGKGSDHCMKVTGLYPAWDSDLLTVLLPDQETSLLRWNSSQKVHFVESNVLTFPVLASQHRIEDLKVPARKREESVG